MGLRILLTIGFLFVHPLLLAADSGQDPPPWEDVEVIPNTSQRPVKSKEVTIENINVTRVVLYVKSFCSECAAANKYLIEHSVKFEKQYVLTTLTGLPGILLSGEKPPIVVIEYSDGSKKRIVGFDEQVYQNFFTPLASGNPDSFGLSDFDIRGSEADKEKDSFDLR